MNKFYWVVSLMLFVCISQAQVYTWTDSQGVVHFSDNPHPGAEKLKLPEAQTFSPPIPKQEIAPVNDDSTPDKDKGEQESYTKIAIREPLNQATIRNPQGYVIVSVELDPPKLGQGDLLQMIFDGSPLGDPQPNMIFELKGIYRGSHTIAVQVVNSEGKVLLTSDAITIYMQQPRVGMGNKGGG